MHKKKKKKSQIPFSFFFSFLFYLTGTQEDSGGLWHGPGLPAVPGPAGLHAWPHLSRWERPGLLPGTPGGGPAQHDQWVSLAPCWWLRTRLTSAHTAVLGVLVEVFLAVLLAGLICCVLNEISSQLLNGRPLNFVHIFRSYRWIVS